MPAHIRNCLDAIDAIGGDPATVGELVAALKVSARIMIRRSDSDGCVYNEEGRARDMADAVLAKVRGMP